MIKEIADSEVPRQARDIISSRLEINGIKNVQVSITGQDRLSVNIPAGGKVPTSFIEELVSRVGHLQFQLVVDSPEHTARIPQYREAYKKWEAEFRAHVELHDAWVAGGKVGEEPQEPPEPAYVVCPEMEKNYDTGKWKERGLLVLSNIPRDVLDGSHIKSAEALIQPGRFGNRIKFSMNNGIEGAIKLEKLTSDNYNERLAIVLDGQVISAPTIKERIGPSAQITGDFSRREARSIATFMAAGKLPAKLTLASRKITRP